MLSIRVKIFGELRAATPEELHISLPAGSTVGDLLLALDIGARDEHMISRNSELVSASARLRDGDFVSIRYLPGR